MRHISRRTLTIFSILGAALFSVSARSALAESQVTVQLDAGNPGPAVPTNYSGLGFEVAILRPETGTHYFRADNQPLINLFHTLK
jgi:hypothetical protein